MNMPQNLALSRISSLPLTQSPLLNWLGIFAFGCLTIQNGIHFVQEVEFLYLARAIFSILVMSAFLWRRIATTIDASLGGFIFTFLHAVTPFFFGIGHGQVVSPEVSWSLIFLGLLTSALGLVDLWEFFGILPAHRGVRTTGLYKYVRHPIYLGYLLTAIGWTSYSYSIRNLLVLCVFCVACILRVLKEERLLLCENSAYATYSMKTRYRIIPWIF
jgi:protein-S-isoprenylcysteine O-methyltransferase Ste14